MTNRNDHIWAEIIRRWKLNLDLPLNIINEQQIKACLGGRRDLRNVVSMTSVKEWAKPLQEKGVFVLGKSRTEWMLVHGKGYKELKEPEETETFHSRLPIELTTLSYGRGENPCVNHALHCGLLSRFTGVRALFETLSGRSGTREFGFHIDDLEGLSDLKVEQGTQMDIDKGYEGKNDVLLFEAKARPQPDFFVRQLYYPFRSHSKYQELTGRKRVRPFVFVAKPEERTYSIWEFQWDDPDDYEAITLVGGKGRRFRIVEEKVPEDELNEIDPVRSVPEIQANDLEKVTSLPFLIPQGIDTAVKWAEHYGFARRQGNYYESAAAALGLVENQEGTFVLTDEGRHFVTLSPPERDKLTAKRLLKVPTINRVFLRARERGPEGVSSAEIARIIEETQGLRGKTPGRRASTVLAWFRWLAIATGTVVVEDHRIYSRAGWDEFHPTRAGRL